MTMDMVFPIDTCSMWVRCGVGESPVPRDAKGDEPVCQFQPPSTSMVVR
ncbi:hypothetical protein G3I76_46800 [Streptomyces sp. SID11233]|nr:hypothetical protein [Streptomyces sp. SID11233]